MKLLCSFLNRYIPFSKVSAFFRTNINEISLADRHSFMVFHSRKFKAKNKLQQGCSLALQFLLNFHELLQSTAEINSSFIKLKNYEEEHIQKVCTTSITVLSKCQKGTKTIRKLIEKEKKNHSVSSLHDVKPSFWWVSPNHTDLFLSNGLGQRKVTSILLDCKKEISWSCTDFKKIVQRMIIMVRFKHVAIIYIRFKISAIIFNDDLVNI